MKIKVHDYKIHGDHAYLSAHVDGKPRQVKTPIHEKLPDDLGKLVLKPKEKLRQELLDHITKRPTQDIEAAFEHGEELEHEHGQEIEAP